MPPPFFLMETTLAHLRIWKAGLEDADILRRGLFRGFRHDRARHARKPAVDELLEPGALGDVIHRARFEMPMPRLRARRIHAIVAARGPAMHHRPGHVRVKLE